jgi:hypothetical protein
MNRAPLKVAIATATLIVPDTLSERAVA